MCVVCQSQRYSFAGLPVVIHNGQESGIRIVPASNVPQQLVQEAHVLSLRLLILALHCIGIVTLLVKCASYIYEASATLVQALEEEAELLYLEGGEEVGQVGHIQPGVREAPGGSPHQARTHLWKR